MSFIFGSSVRCGLSVFPILCNSTHLTRRNHPRFSWFVSRIPYSAFLPRYVTFYDTFSLSNRDAAVTIILFLLIFTLRQSSRFQYFSVHFFFIRFARFVVGRFFPFQHRIRVGYERSKPADQRAQVHTAGGERDGWYISCWCAVLLLCAWNYQPRVYGGSESFVVGGWSVKRSTRTNEREREKKK